MQGEGFGKRVRIIGYAIVITAVLAGLRLGYLQIIRHGYYTVLASEEQRRKYEIPSNRGDIYFIDRGQKTPAVLNRTLQLLYADPRYVTNKAETAKTLAELSGGNQAEYEEALNSQAYYVVLKKNVEPAQAAAIDALQLPGVGLSDMAVRVYPEGDLGAQVLGFVNADGQGQYGIEEFYNPQLEGSKGLLNAKTDTRGIPIATSDNVQLRPVDGTDIVLTIDRNIQAQVEKIIREGTERYKSKNASAVVLDPNNGRVLAMANYPTFDPAKYQEVTDYSVFANRVATGLYEPGSVIKVFAMSAGLNTGAVTPQTTFQNTGSVQVADYTIKNAQGIPNGTMTMADVLTKSVNTGMVQVLKALGGGEINLQGKTKLYEYYTQHFLLGEPTGVQAPGEPGGIIPPPTENDVTYANMTFGQGMTATMIQIAQGYAAIANGGTIYQPNLVDHLVDPDGNVSKVEPVVRRSDVISKQTASEITSMMQGVIDHAVGIGVKLPGYTLAGKTGTAQIPNPNGGYFENRDIGSFAGFGPTNQPRYVVIVRADEPTAAITAFAGSGAAGPMWGSIMSWLMTYNGVPPS